MKIVLNFPLYSEISVPTYDNGLTCYCDQEDYENLCNELLQLRDIILRATEKGRLKNRKLRIFLWSLRVIGILVIVYDLANGNTSPFLGLIPLLCSFMFPSIPDYRVEVCDYLERALEFMIYKFEKKHPRLTLECKIFMLTPHYSKDVQSYSISIICLCDDRNNNGHPVWFR